MVGLLKIKYYKYITFKFLKSPVKLSDNILRVWQIVTKSYFVISKNFS